MNFNQTPMNDLPKLAVFSFVFAFALYWVGLIFFIL